jgi:hypothetical protein
MERLMEIVEEKKEELGSGAYLEMSNIIQRGYDFEKAPCLTVINFEHDSNVCLCKMIKYQDDTIIKTNHFMVIQGIVSKNDYKKFKKDNKNKNIKMVQYKQYKKF